MVLDEGWIEGQRSKEAHRFYEFAPRDRYFNEGPLDEEWNDIWPLNIYENWIWKAWEKEGGGEGAKANTTNKEHTQHNPFSLLLIIAMFFFSFFRSSVSVFGSNCLWFESWTQSRAPFGSETSEFELIFCWICSWLLLLLLSIIGERSEWNFDFSFFFFLNYCFDGGRWSWGEWWRSQEYCVKRRRCECPVAVRCSRQEARAAARFHRFRWDAGAAAAAGDFATAAFCFCQGWVSFFNPKCFLFFISQEYGFSDFLEKK